MKVNRIICGRFEEVAKDFPDEFVDLTVTSPPYGEIRDYKGYIFNWRELARELYRITKEGGVVVWVVGDQTIDGDETGTSFKQTLYFKDIGFKLHDTMIYEKDSGPYPAGEKSTRYTQCFEYMFVFSKGRPKTINLIRDKKNKYLIQKSQTYRQKDGTLKKGKDVISSEFGVRYNVWRIPSGYMKSTTDEIAYKHPAIFPEKLAEDHIMSWSNLGDLVLDPMACSGTTLKMAYINNRKFLGVEISEEYCEIAKKRMEGLTRKLF